MLLIAKNGRPHQQKRSQWTSMAGKKNRAPEAAPCKPQDDLKIQKNMQNTNKSSKYGMERHIKNSNTNKTKEYKKKSKNKNKDKNKNKNNTHERFIVVP